MTPSAAGQSALQAAVRDAGCAEMEFDDARAWLGQARKAPMEPIAAEVWLFDAAARHVLLVRHRWRGIRATAFPEDLPRIRAYAARHPQDRADKGR